nr:reverse transcriptase domain-containing protein [Tanacetum cinerariifolium]
MEEMMITTTAFIRGEEAAASKKKGHVSWKPQDQSKRHSADKRSDFRDHSREERKPNRSTPSPGLRKKSWLPKQLKKQNEKLVRAGKLSHLIKEIKQGRDQTVKPKVTQSFERVGEIAFPKLAARQLRLLVTIGATTYSTRAWMNFMVVKSMSPYNGIIGRPGLKAIQTVPSTVYVMLKFPIEGGIATIRNTILIPAECASVTTSAVIPGEEKSRPANFTVALHPDFPDQEVVIRGSLSDKGR